MSKNNNEELLYNACLNDRYNSVKTLLDKKPSINAVNEALRIASKKSNLQIVKLLVEKGNADIRTNDEEPMRWACFKGNLELIKYFLEKGAKLHSHYGPKYVSGYRVADCCYENTYTSKHKPVSIFSEEKNHKR